MAIVVIFAEKLLGFQIHIADIFNLWQAQMVRSRRPRRQQRHRIPTSQRCCFLALVQLGAQNIGRAPVINVLSFDFGGHLELLGVKGWRDQVGTGARDFAIGSL